MRIASKARSLRRRTSDFRSRRSTRAGPRWYSRAASSTAGPATPEEGDAPPVGAADLDALDLAAADEAQRPKEEVVGLETCPSHGLREERWVGFLRIEVGPSLL